MNGKESKDTQDINKRKASPPKSVSRQDALAAQMRENLKRRKAQSRARQDRDKDA